MELHLASTMIAIWKALQWPTAVLFVIFSYALIYSFGPNAAGEALALDHAGFGVRRDLVARRFGRISYLSAVS